MRLNVTSGATASSGREAGVCSQRRKVKRKKKEKHRKERKEVAQLKASDERGRKKAGAQKREEMRR